MAFNAQEQEIIRAGQQNGKSVDEIKTAVTRYRLGLGPVQKTQPKEVTPNLVASYGSDVAEAAKAGMEKVVSGVTDKESFPGEGIIKSAAGATEVATSPLAPLFSPLGKVIGYVANKISDLKGVQDFAESTPGKIAAKIAETTGNASEVIGTIAGGKGVGVGMSKAASETSSLLGDITATGAKGIQEATAKAIDPSALMQRVARISKGKQSAFEDLAGESVGQYLVNRGIFGTPDKIVDQLYERFTQSKDKVDTALAQLPGTYKTPAIGNAIKQLAEREASVSSPGAPSRNLEAVRELQRKFNGAGLTMSEINSVKRLYESTVRLDYLKQNLPAKVEAANSVDSAIRTWQQSQAEKLGYKTIRQDNKETQLARQLTDDLGAEYSGQGGNNAVSLTDWITLSGGSAASAAMFLTKKAVTSKTVMSAIAQKMSKTTPQTIEKPVIGPATIDAYLEFLKRTGNDVP